MASVFDQVIAVDVAPTMLERLRENCDVRGITNVKPFHVSERWEQTTADLVYSYLVFQHIEEDEVIDELLRRTATALASDGVSFIQFDTRPRSRGYRIRSELPDAALPRPWRRGLRRIRREREELTQLFAANGLAVVEELRPSTDLNSFILRNSERL